MSDKTQELIEQIDIITSKFLPPTARFIIDRCKYQLIYQDDEIKRLRETATGELPLHASTGLNSFVTRIEKDIKAARNGLSYVNTRDLKDLLHHFIRLDNEARASTQDKRIN